MRILITGASGFVGRHAQKRFERDGHTVDAVDRELDVTDEAALRQALAERRPDAILHLAAISSVPESLRAPDLCHRVNFLGTKNLLAAAAASAPEARLVLVGSADQYHATAPREAPFDESTPLRPRSPYARTKAAAELLGRLALADGRDVVLIRAFNHTGVGQREDFVTASFARQIAEIRIGLRSPVMRVGNLESVRDFLDVDDVVDAYARLIEPGGPKGVFNVASGVATRIGDLIDRLAEVAGVAPKLERDPARHRPTDWLVGDATRLREATGWSPHTPLRDTLAAMLEDWTRRLSPAPADGAA